MTTSMISKSCIRCSVLAAVAVLAAPSQAQTTNSADSAARGCNNKTIDGAYASVANEWIGTSPPYTPLAAVRHTVFDGKKGTFTSEGYLSTAGTIMQFALDGTYIV